MAFRLSDSIRADLLNIKVAGETVEYSVKDFFKRRFFPRYHVSEGHIVDSSLKVSPQFDIIVAENSRNPVMFDLAGGSELVFFEPVFCFAEVKRSFYKNNDKNKRNPIEAFSNNIERLKKELIRDPIPPNFIESGDSGLYLEKPLTSLPLRNPIFSFLFFVDGSKIDGKKLGAYLRSRDNAFLPNFIVFLDQGIVLNVNRSLFERGEIKINLYPEFEKDANVWVFLALNEEHEVLTFQYMLLVEHLNSSLVSSPNVRRYTSGLFGLSSLNFRDL